MYLTNMLQQFSKTYTEVLPIDVTLVNGINYAHFQSVTDTEDQEGYLIESVKGVVK
jgi:hypothetical protein